MKEISIKIIISISLFCCSAAAFSQKENNDIKKGNEQYDQGKYDQAEIEYHKGLQKNSQSYGANYNLGNTLYNQKKYEDAIQQYQIAGSKLKENDKLGKADVAHNLGNALLKTGKYAESIQAYKQALRYNPNNEETRYNLAYAQQMLQQQQQQQPQQNEDNQDQNKDQNDQNKNQQQQEQQQQNDQNMSKENAEQILKAIEEDEKDIQEKIKLKEKKDTKRYNVEKEW